MDKKYDFKDKQLNLPQFFNLHIIKEISFNHLQINKMWESLKFPPLPHHSRLHQI
jgi:hypothetical protein